MPSIPDDLEGSRSVRALNTSDSEMIMSVRVEEEAGISVSGRTGLRDLVKVELK